MDENELSQATEKFASSGLPEAYEYALEKLCIEKLPKTDYFELCAQFILEYERMLLSRKLKNKLVLFKPNKDLIINLPISQYEFLCPILLKKNKSIVIKVKGKWSMDKKAKNLDFRGYIDSKETCNSFPLGALLGRNSSCPEKGYFKIFTGMRYTPEKTGILFTTFNYNWYSNLNVQGEPSLIISFASFVEENTIFKEVGLDYPDMEQEENILLKYINIARVHPKTFGDAFLGHLIKGNSHIASFHKDLSQMEPLVPLKANKFLTTIAEQLSSDLGKSGRVSHYDSNKRNVKGRAKAHLKTMTEDKDLQESFLDLKECYCTVKSPINPLFTILNMLVDELLPSFENRKCLLNENIKYCGISISEHINYSNICVINFSEKNY